MKENRRVTTVNRETKETQIRMTLCLDGSGQSDIQTGIGFLDHMLESLAKHARLDLTLHCEGDLRVDGHHTTEDCALVLGQGIAECLGERRGIPSPGRRRKSRIT